MNNKKERKKTVSNNHGNKSKKNPVWNHQTQSLQNKISKAKSKNTACTVKKSLPKSGKKSSPSVNLTKTGASKITNDSLTKQNKQGKKSSDNVSPILPNYDREQVSPKKRSKGRPSFKHKAEQSKSNDDNQLAEAATSHLIPGTSKQSMKTKSKSSITTNLKSIKLTKAKHDKSKPTSVKSNKNDHDKATTKSKSSQSLKKTTVKAKEKKEQKNTNVKAKQDKVIVKAKSQKVKVKDQVKQEESTSEKNKTKNTGPKQAKKSKVKTSSKSVFPKRRGHRVASLNAIAKVKLLCENDRDTSSTSSKHGGEVNKESLKTSAMNNNSKSTANATKNNNRGPKTELKSKIKKVMVIKKDKKSKLKINKSKVVNKKQKKKKKLIRTRPLVDPNVEIIDTRRCKRMASLNASAMMAATYLPEVKNDRQLVLVRSPEPPSTRVTSRTEDPLAAISETIDEVVRQWSSTVEQHIKISPSSSHSTNESQCRKTTVKTTVKHVKMSHNNTVVETISTQIEQQGIMPESSDLSARTVGSRSSLNRGVTNHISASSSSAFTPCSSSCLQSTSHSPLMPNSKRSFSDTPTFITPSVSSTSSKKSKKRKHKQNSEHPQGSNQTSSFIQKYEMKTIETLMQSANDTGHVHNSTVSNSIIVTNNTPGPSSIFNFNSAGSALAPNNNLMPYSLYNPVPFQLIPLPNTSHVAPQFQQHVSSLSPYITTGDPNAAINYINLNTPIMQCQSMPANPYTANALPFVQLANANQSHDFNHPLYGVSYINPAANSAAIFNSANPIINLLPNSSNQASTLLHRPVPFHPQSGQLSSTIASSALNNSNVMTSPVIGGMAAPIQSNMFNYPLIRPSNVNSSLQSVNLPMTSFSQPTVLLPNSISNSSSGTMAMSNPASHTQHVNQQFSFFQPTSTVTEAMNHTSKPKSEVPCIIEVDGLQSVASSRSDSENHLGQLANMTHNIEPSTSSSPHKIAVIANNSSESPNKNRNKKLLAPLTHGNISINLEKLANGKSLVNKLNRPKLNPPNGTYYNQGVELSLNNKKKLKINKAVSIENRNGLKSNIRPVLNKPVKQTKMSPPSEKNVKGMTMNQHSLLGPSPMLSFPNSNGLKKNKRPIVHGWSWEGQPSEGNIYINNDDQSYRRKCYPAIKHNEGEVIRVRDCVLLKSGTRKNDLPFVAKITSLWESPEKEMMMSLLWYYRPEHTDVQESFITGEIYASRHRDANSVACIDDKCYVLTYNEYCRYKRQRAHMLQAPNLQQGRSQLVVPHDPSGISPRNDRLPPINTLPELVFCCRKVYDFRQKRILKNPY